MNIFSIRSFGLAALAALSLTASAALIPDGQSVGSIKPIAPRQWHHRVDTRFADFKANRNRVVTKGDSKITDANSFGILYGPDGLEWTYTAQFTPDGLNGYSRAKMTIYNAQNKVVGSIDAPFQLADNETAVNSVMIHPMITRKLFNVDDRYEVVLFVHATTKDYRGSIYQLVYSIAPDQTEPLMRIDGNMSIMADAATDSWSEKIHAAMVREVWEDDEYFIAFDLYAYADWSSRNAPRLLHSFKIPYELVSGSGGDAYPMAMQAVDGKFYYAIAYYQKPYFDPTIPFTQEPVVNPDNTFIIDIYDDAALEADTPQPIHTTRIPMTSREGYLYTFPLLGGFMGNDDFSFGDFGPADKPYFVVTMDKYVTATDDFVSDYEVYDWDGNKVKTIATDVEGCMSLMPVPGYPDQYVFFNSANQEYHVANFPEFDEACVIPFVNDGYTYMTDMDRAITPEGFNYVFSCFGGHDAGNGDVEHVIAWVNPDGTLNRYDKVNLGPDVVMAQPCIIGEWLSPFLFNTDKQVEYMFLVKVPDGKSTSSTEEHLWIRNADGKNILDFGPDPEMGVLSSISVMNYNGENPQLSTAYYDWEADSYTLVFNSLPLVVLEKGGDGTADNPYLISEPGDLLVINKNPEAFYKLANDIDCQGIPMNFSEFDFSGSIDGNGHTISNVNIIGSGLFGRILGAASVKNLVLSNVTINPTAESAGVISSMLSYDGEFSPVIENVHVCGLEAASTDFDGAFGGLVGTLATGSSIKNSSVSEANISLPRAEVGGIVGTISVSGGYVTVASFSGSITGGAVGGIVGIVGYGIINNCHVNADLEGSECVGGIVGDLGAYMGVRGNVDHCYVEGYIRSTNTRDASVGGIVGTLSEDGDNLAVCNNVVAASEIASTQGVLNDTRHRIAGHTAGDVLGAIDWEDPWWEEMAEKGEDPYDHQDEWPRLPVDPEQGLLNNYAVDTLPINGPASLDDVNSVEGKSIAAADITRDFLDEQEFAFGDSYDSPWTIAEGKPSLYFEVVAKSILADVDRYSIVATEQGEIAFTVIGGSADGVEVTSSDEAVVVVKSVNVEGDRITVALEALSEGEAVITATIGSVSATCVVTSRVSGVEDIVSDAADAPVEWYNLQGMRISNPLRGQILIRRQGDKATKVIVR